MATYVFKTGQDKIDDNSKTILKTAPASSELSITELNRQLVALKARRDGFNADIANLEAELAQIREDLSIDEVKA